MDNIAENMLPEPTERSPLTPQEQISYFYNIFPISQGGAVDVPIVKWLVKKGYIRKGDFPPAMTEPAKDLNVPEYHAVSGFYEEEAQYTWDIFYEYSNEPEKVEDSLEELEKSVLVSMLNADSRILDEGRKRYTVHQSDNSWNDQRASMVRKFIIEGKIPGPPAYKELGKKLKEMLLEESDDEDISKAYSRLVESWQKYHPGQSFIPEKLSS